MSGVGPWRSIGQIILMAASSLMPTANYVCVLFKALHR